MPKVIFLHGFFASGACTPAQALKEGLSSKAQVLTPDLPLHPQEALTFLRRLCQQEAPDVLVGNSNGAFLAQIIAAENNLPALLGNPYFEMTKFLTERIGLDEYKSPRANGNQHFVIDQPLIDEFAEVQLHQLGPLPAREPRTYLGNLWRERSSGPLRVPLPEILSPRLAFSGCPYPYGRRSTKVLHSAHRKTLNPLTPCTSFWPSIHSKAASLPKR